MSEGPSDGKSLEAEYVAASPSLVQEEGPIRALEQKQRKRKYIRTFLDRYYTCFGSLLVIPILLIQISFSLRLAFPANLDQFVITTTQGNDNHALFGETINNQSILSREISLIPKPALLNLIQGQKRFFITKKTRILVSDQVALPEAELLAETLRPSTGFPLRVEVLPEGCSEQKQHICLMLLEDDGGNDHGKQQQSKSKEAYVLDVGSSSSKNGVLIASFARNGLFYGTQTFLQLLPPPIFSPKLVRLSHWDAPPVHIEDAPRFSWRGMHLDSCRHFMPVEFILKFIKLLALHKFNTFHWHLTEDQGWRIEIRKYPKLTQIAAWRNQTIKGKTQSYDGKRHGGFYTQEQIRDIVAYAARHHITVVPEIEMPGHTQAVFAAYPHLACRPHVHYEVKTEWGVSQEVFCAGNDKTFEFLENVLKEVLDLFPSPYIHIGGDECPKVRWQSCSKCQKRMKDEGLSDENHLQTWFMQKIQKFLASHGRQVIGWDEIMDGDAARFLNATVMSWRGMDPAYRAVKAGRKAVLSSVDTLYFDWYQAKPEIREPLAWGGYTPLEKVYNFRPFSSDLSENQRRGILGAQGQLWTEYMPNFRQVEYMAFPRAAALAEVVWFPTPDGESLDFSEFLKRLIRGHLPRLDALGVNYRDPKNNRRGAESRRRLEGIPYPSLEDDHNNLDPVDPEDRFHGIPFPTLEHDNHDDNMEHAHHDHHFHEEDYYDETT